MLDSLIERAATANLDLKIAATRVLESRAQRQVARADRVPTFDVGAGALSTQQADNGAVLKPPGGFPRFEQYDVNLGATWEVDVFGRVRRNIEAAEAALAADVEDYRDVSVALFAEVASSYVDVRTAQARLDFARDNVAAQDASVALTRNRFSAGLTSSLDVAQAESNLATTAAAIPSLEQNLEFALNRLAFLLGEQPGAVHEELSAVAPIPEPPASLTLELPADLLRRRPDVRAAERRLASQTALVGVATARLYPSFSLDGVIGLVTIDLDDLLDEDSLLWQIGAGMTWRVADGGRNRGFIEAEEARTQQLYLAYEGTVLAALGEVENSLAGYWLERDRRDRLEEAVEATQRSVDLVQTQYKSGLTNFQNVLDTQRTLAQRQDELAASEGRVVQALISLNRAMGGGWPLEDAEAQSEVLLGASLEDPTTPPAQGPR